MSDRNLHPDIGAFNAADPLSLRMVENGGWVVSQHAGKSGVIPRDLGAYSCAREMLDALSSVLCPSPVTTRDLAAENLDRISKSRPKYNTPEEMIAGCGMSEGEE